MLERVSIEGITPHELYKLKVFLGRMEHVRDSANDADSKAEPKYALGDRTQ